MRFSTFLNARSMGPEQDRDVMLRMIAHTERAEAAGFDAVFLPDHHFTGYMPMASDPFMFASYLAAKVKRMHFGFSVTTVPLHNPVRFVERINILDQLTEGRVLVGIGSGTTPEEMIGFGVNYKDATRIADENLAIAEQLWAKQAHDEPVVFETGHYKGEVVQRIAPIAYTPGHAKLMPVAMKETSARRAAENGWPAFIPAFTPPKIGGTEPMLHVRKYFTIYRDMLLAAGHAPKVVADALSWSTHTYQCVHIAETDEQARKELEDILTDYQAAVDREAAFNAKAEQTEANKKTDKNHHALTEDWIGTWCLYGSPETVIEHLKPYQELGIGNILCGLLTGPLTEKREAYANQTMDLMARHVIPALKGGAA
ncbi:LLM class flavin-dependent oxidoreductase [Niveispirillum sp. KHB5.9]|uniref:LLM class flavin-dependent oxidoreductase n=1 Tax=Niveispirillum sp. KHB5.9 TaxID=3400269 RepID=UPI003A8B3A39